MLSRSEIDRYVDQLVVAHSGVAQVWLIGSQANGTATPDSDWDLLAFGDFAVLDALRHDVRFQHDQIDLLVVTSEVGEFQKPWGETPKTGSLSNWQWKKISEDQATYQGGKWVPDPVQKYPGTQNGNITDQTLRAIRLWPKA